MIKGIEQLNKNNFKKTENDPYMDIARGMESQFINYLLSEMRKTVDESEAPGQEEQFYKGLLDTEYSRIMANKDHGLGIQDIILKQIKPKQAISQIYKEVGNNE